MRKKILIFLAIILSAILIGGIFYFFKNSQSGEEKKEQLTDVSIGVIVNSDSEIKKYEAFAEYLNKKSDHKWHIVPLRDYGSFISQLEEKQIVAGFMGSAAGYRAIKAGLATPVARGQKDGVSTYYGYVFTRRDSGLDTIEKLRGKKFAYVDITTSAGYLFPVHLLKNKGYDPENFFRVASFLGSHEKAIMSVFNGDYDGGAAKDSAWRKLAEENPEIESNLRILFQEGPFPENTFMINPDLGVGEVDELRNLLLRMDDSEEGRGYLAKIGVDRFVATSKDDFSVVKKIVDF